MKGVNFILGNRCLSGCAHCFSESSPLDTNRLNTIKALSLCSELESYPQIKEIWFNGGEPFLYLKDMISIIGRAIKNADRKIIISTGVQPFKNLSVSMKILSDLPKVDEIWASIDEYHLVKAPISNYKALATACKDLGISLILSISYDSIKALAKILEVIHSSEISYLRIEKQPVFRFGNAKSLEHVQEIQSTTIPSDFKCGETQFVTVWPDGTISNCSAYAGRTGNVVKSQSFAEFFEKNKDDSFFIDRCTKTLKEIAESRRVSGKIDVTSPCSVCKSILNYKSEFQGASENAG